MILVYTVSYILREIFEKSKYSSPVDRFATLLFFFKWPVLKKENVLNISNRVEIGKNSTRKVGNMYIIIYLFNYHWDNM